MRLTCLALLVSLVTVPALAADTSGVTIAMPSQLQWATNKDLPPGVKMAVLSGDPTKEGIAVIRLMLPDGAMFPPHTHPTAEHVTVISGTLLVGLGATVDTAKMTALPVGAYAYIPAGVAHYAKAQGDTIVQVGGMGPLTVVPVKPSGM